MYQMARVMGSESVSKQLDGRSSRIAGVLTGFTNPGVWSVLFPLWCAFRRLSFSRKTFCAWIDACVCVCVCVRVCFVLLRGRLGKGLASAD